MTKGSNLEVAFNDITNIKEKIGEINTKIGEIDKKLEQSYVTIKEFEPIRNLVYGLVGLILLGVITALIKLVILQ